MLRTKIDIMKPFMMLLTNFPKLIVGVILVLSSQFLVAALDGLFGTYGKLAGYILLAIIVIFLLGFSIKSAHSEIADRELCWPDWITDLNSCIIRGFLTLLVIFLYFMAFMVLMQGLIFLMGYLIETLFIMLGIIFLVFVVPFSIISYAETFSFKSAFDLKRNISLIKNVPGEYSVSTGAALFLIFLNFYIPNFSLAEIFNGALVCQITIFPSFLIILNFYSQTFRLSVKQELQDLQLAQKRNQLQVQSQPQGEQL